MPAATGHAAATTTQGIVTLGKLPELCCVETDLIVEVSSDISLGSGMRSGVT